MILRSHNIHLFNILQIVTHIPAEYVNAMLNFQCYSSYFVTIHKFRTVKPQKFSRYLLLFCNSFHCQQGLHLIWTSDFQNMQTVCNGLTCCFTQEQTSLFQDI